MQNNSDANRNGKEPQISQTYSGYRQKQGYITLSPSRKLKDRNKS